MGEPSSEQAPPTHVTQGLAAAPVLPRHAAVADLHHIVASGWAVLLIAAIAAAFVFVKKGAMLALIAGLAFVLVAARRISARYGAPAASRFLVAALWAVVSGLVVYSGGSGSVLVSAFVPLVVVAGLFDGRRAALITTGACSATLLVAAGLEVSGHLPQPYFPLPPFSAWAAVSIVLLAALAPLDRSLGLFREALHAAQESERKYRFLTENIQDVIWILDLEAMRFTYVSPSVEKLRGYAPEEVIALPAMDALTPASRDLVERETTVNIQAFLERGDAEPRVLEVEQPRRDGTTVWTEVITYPRRNPENGRLEAIGVSRNISARKRLEEQLRQSQKMEAVGQLAGGVAHDFNNILAAMMMSFGLLRQGVKQGSEDALMLDQVHGLAERAAGLTRQLLMFSSRSMLETRVFELGALVEQMMSMLHRLIGEHISVSVERGAEPLAVSVDRSMLEQVLINLVVNARDAMPQGGHLRIATRAVKVDTAHVELHAEAKVGELAVLEVVDDGEGMDAATVTHVFEPFFTTKLHGKGSGLGLATVHGIVKQHGGWIEVESAPGRGSTFRVYLPRSNEPIESLASPHAPVAAQGSETVLLVEDEPLVRRTLSRYLRSQHYRVLEAASGVEALAVWAEKRDEIEIVISDVMMPGGVSGVDLARRLREDEDDLPIILNTGYSQDVLAPEAGLPQGVRCLAKPVEPKELTRVMRALLDA